MAKYKVRVYADMEFEIEADSDYDINHEATCYVEDNKHELNWSFDSIQNLETKKYI